MLRRLAAVLAAVLCAPAAAAAPIRVGGSGTWLGVAERLGAAYAKVHPGERIEVLPSIGTSGAIVAVAKGALDLGLAGREVDETERGLGLRSVEVGRTPFAVAVGATSPATTITEAQLVEILRGQRTRWPDGQRIRLILRPPSDADSRYIRTISPAVQAALDVALAREGMLVAATNQDCHALLRQTPGALGFSSLAQLRTEGEGLKALAWNGVAPTAEALARGEYPLPKPFVLVHRAHLDPRVERFLAFVRSREGAEVMKGLGVVPAAPPADASGAR